MVAFATGVTSLVTLLGNATKLTTEVVEEVVVATAEGPAILEEVVVVVVAAEAGVAERNVTNATVSVILHGSAGKQIVATNVTGSVTLLETAVGHQMNPCAIIAASPVILLVSVPKDVARARPATTVVNKVTLVAIAPIQRTIARMMEVVQTNLLCYTSDPEGGQQLITPLIE